MGKKPRRTWPEAELRWLQEMKDKRSIGYDIIHFEWLANHMNKYYLDDITKDVIENIACIKESTGVTPATVNRVLALVRSVLNRAYKVWDWVDRVPLVQMRKENNKRLRWLKRDEADKLLNELPAHLRAMAAFTLATGLRASNVSLLEWREIDINRQHAVLPPQKMKTNRYLGVPLNDDAMKILADQKGKHEKFVFVYRGKPVTQCSTRAFRLALERAGIEDFRWHDLRHTWASWHVQKGTSLQELMELGGWASLDMVMRYAHLCSKQLKRAAERLCGAEMVKKDGEVKED